MSRFIERDANKEEKEESIDNYKDLFLPLVEKSPTLEEAIDQLLKSEKLEEEDVHLKRTKIIKESMKIVEKNFERIVKVHPNVTKDEALVISTYCYEDEDYRCSLYKILNKNIVSQDRRNGISNVYKYCFLLLKSLRHLNIIKLDGQFLFRVLGAKVTDIRDKNPNYIPYKEGNIKTFLSFISTSLKVYTDFLREKDGNNLKTGTIFTISGDIIGYDISLFSMYEDDHEILVEPERKYKIQTVYEVNDVVNVICHILKTPLVLEDIIKVKNQD